MRIFSELMAFARNLLRRERVERDLDEEMKSYLALSTAAKRRSGQEEETARREAATEFGGVEQVKEEVRAARLSYFLEMRWQDLRFAFRTLRKAPVFSFTVIAVLALGIGSAALMFTIVNALLLRGPEFPEADRLYTLFQKIPTEDRVPFSVKEFAAWEKQTEVFASLASLASSSFTFSGHGEPELLLGQMVTPSFFAVLQTAPALGRAFLETDGKVGQDHVVILSHRLWREKFGGRSEVVGEQMTMNGESYRILGVMGERFSFPDAEAMLWVPVDLRSPLFQEHPDAHFLRVVGRLKPGVTRKRLQAEVDLLGRRVDDPSDRTPRLYLAQSLQEMLAGDLRTPLLILFGAVGLLLLIACANVANLMLARASAREGEMAMRAALGASRSRLVAQLLAESGLLALAGGSLGVGVASWGLDLLRRFAQVPELAQARIEPSVLAFVVLVSFLCGVLFGLAPACGSVRHNLQEALGGAIRSTRRGLGAQQALVFAEVALVSVLLIGCTLMLHSFVRLMHVSPGFVPKNLLAVNLSLSPERYPEKPQLLALYRESLAQVCATPGVERAALITHLPFGGNSWGNSLEVEGQPAGSANESAQIRPVSPGFFGTMGIPLRSGRDFDERDNATAPGVAIVSAGFAQRYWPNENAIGKRVRYFKDWLTVVGVCGDIKHAALEEAAAATVYTPYPQVLAEVIQFVGRDLNFVVRSTSLSAAATGVRSTLQTLTPGAVVKINPMEELIHASAARPRFRTWLILIFSLFALTLAALGIYGVIAYLVTQRYQEIGIRLALGATRTNVLRLILDGTLKLAVAGTIAGIGVAFFVSRFLSSILFGITTHDPVTFVAVPLGLIVIALLAGYLPARRATRIDPVRSLRYE